MTNTKAAPKFPQPPLADGQVWQMAELNLQVGMVGKLLVHYTNSPSPMPCVFPTSLAALLPFQKFLKKNKAVLLPPVPVAPRRGEEESAGREKTGCQEPVVAAKKSK